MLKKFWPHFAILGAGLIALALTYLYQYHWLRHIGLPLDDSYIHLQFAKNIIAGKWFVYTDSQPATPGDTSPLWIILIAGVGLFCKNLATASLVLGGLFYILTGLVAFQLGRRFFSDAFALGFALVVIFTGRMLWAAASGMEVTLFSFLCLLGILLYLRGKEQKRFSVSAAAVFGLAVNARPEGYLLFLLALLDWILIEKISREKKLSAAQIPWIQGMVFLLLALPYPIFSLVSTGHFTPNTFRATRLPFGWERSWEYLKLVIETFYNDHLLLHLALPLGAVVFFAQAVKTRGKEHGGFLLWLWPAGYLVASFFLTPLSFHFQRYIIPVLPFFILLSFYGWEWALQKAGRLMRPRPASIVNYVFISIIIVWAALISLGSWPQIAARCVKNIDEMQIKIGRWVRDNTKPDEMIAANDIGAIFYISDRPALDLAGLTNPEILNQVQGLNIRNQERDRITLKYLQQKRPDYLIVFPKWFPRMVENTQYFQPVFSVRIEDRIIVPAKEMTVYKCSWPGK